LIKEAGGYDILKQSIATNKVFLENFPKEPKNTTVVEQVLFAKNYDSKNSSPKVLILNEKIQSLCNQYHQLIESCWEEIKLSTL